MKFSLPANAKDAGPHKYQPVMPPNTAASQVASQGSSKATANVTANSRPEMIKGFKGSVASYTAPSLPKPLYDKPKVR